MIENDGLESPEEDVAARIAAQTMAKRGIDYTGEVRRLLDAAYQVIEQNGTESRARVADIVAAAGLSNEAFYRHFASKDALVAALIEDGAQRLASYVEHQMAKETTPQGRLERWVTAVLSQATGRTASTTVAVLWNGSHFDGGAARGRSETTAPVARLLHDPLRQLGSPDPALDAALVAHAVVGRMSAHLWGGTRPSIEEARRTTAFCISAVSGGGGPR